MQTMRPLLRQALRGHSRIFRVSIRLQSSQHGQHKEYFQDPSHFPSAAEIAAKPLSRYPEHTTIAPPYPQTQRKTGPSRLIRFARGTVLSVFSLAAGALTGVALVTWSYLSPPFEPGSEEEEELFEEIQDLMTSHPLDASLLRQGWQETVVRWPDADGRVGRNLVTDVLNNSQGLLHRVFRHPFTHTTMILFFMGYGLESWPDIIHGGATSTALHQAIDEHCAPLIEHGLKYSCEMSINFRRPLHPGQIYSVLLPPPLYQIVEVPNASQPDAEPGYEILAYIKGMVTMTEEAPIVGLVDNSSNSDLVEVIKRDGQPVRTGNPSSKSEVNPGVCAELDAVLHARVDQFPVGFEHLAQLPPEAEEHRELLYNIVGMLLQVNGARYLAANPVVSSEHGR